MAMFRDVDSKPDFPALEREILAFWEMEKPFDALRERNANGKPWSFVDGPITANNPMGVHHAWGRTYKDIFQRHRAMLGHHQRYQNGFDCQGLWVEVEVEKALGLGGKREIEAYGLAEFSKRCRERVEKYAAVQTEQSKRLGQWMDWDNSYYTMTDRNIESIWGFLKLCHEKGWLYKGQRSMPWCPRCGCSLSAHEQTNSYKDMVHRAVYLKLPLTDDPSTKLVAWTTTPWTLSANVALAVNPELDYLKVKVGDEVLVLADGEVPKQALAGLGDIKVLETVKGADLVGLTYSGPIEVEPRAGLELKVIPWKDVALEEGTGIVHIAPGCGAEDFELSKVHDLAVIVPIDENGCYTEAFGEFAGKGAHEVAQQVFDHLEQRGHLHKTHDYEHRYPVCWRCKEELVFRAVEEWFISCEEIRKKLMAQAKKVRWIPEYAGKRMLDWLEKMGDWCISRKRYWGLPLPFYVSDDGEELLVVGSQEELMQLAPEGTEAPQELHRPWIDDVKVVSPASGKTLTRVLDVGDCWLDAGIVFHSTMSYGEDREEWQKWFPADFICEMVEQVRLWFYSTLFMSVALEGKAPYQCVKTYESVVSEDKSRFSKTGYNIPFDEGAETMGADVMRWLYASAPGNRNVRFGYNLGDEARGKLLTLWNTYAFFVQYANLMEPKHLEKPLLSANLTDIDRWVMARMQQCTAACRESLENYDTATMTREVERFIDDLSNWYVRLNRARFSSDAEKDRALAFAVLYTCLKTVIRLVAPVLPFTAEKIYQNLVRKAEPEAVPSVHLTKYPRIETSMASETIVADMQVVQQVCQLARKARERAKLKVRQPLREVIVRVERPDRERSLQTFSGLVAQELNVKAVKLLSDLSSVQTYTVKPNFKLLGRKYGKEMPTVQAAIAAQDALELTRAVRTGRDVSFEHEGVSYRLKPEELVIEAAFAEHLEPVEEHGVLVALNTKLTPELRLEGLARDVIRQVQSLRKDLDYKLSDKVDVQLAGADEELTKAVDAHSSLIQGKIKAEGLALVEAVSHRDSKQVPIGEAEVTIGVARR